MLVRRIARPLLAAPFILGGIGTFKKPQDRVPAAAPIVEKVADKADKQLPIEVPRDVEQWVKADSALKVVAGTMLALGKWPRLAALALSASLVPTTLAGHPFWRYTDRTERLTQLSHFVKNLGLLGGLLLAVVDTEGKPSVGYRARRAASKAADSTEKSFEKAQKRTAKAQRKAAKRVTKVRKVKS